MGEVDPTGSISVPVELGLVTDAYAEIRSGLEEGDVVSIPATQSPVAAEEAGFPGFGMFGGGRP
jgi:hypothetical protein